MSESASWEEKFVSSYVLKPKRNRYLTFLKGKKRRQILDRLNHSLDYDERRATTLDKRYKDSAHLNQLLRQHGVSDTCVLMADVNDLDGSTLALEAGIEQLLGKEFGAVLICPPKPIAVYKDEDPGTLLLLA